MNRKKDLAALLRHVPNDFVVAENPDHPYLFAGPDLLAGRAGQLVAFFYPTFAERARPGELEIRLVLSRLALPKHTRCILAYTQNDLRARFNPDSFYRHFHAVIDIDDVGQVREAFLAAQIGFPVQEIPDRIRTSVNRRFAFLLSVSSGRIALPHVEDANAAEHGLPVSKSVVSSSIPSGMRDSTSLWSHVADIRPAYPSFAASVRAVDSVLITSWRGTESMGAMRVLQSYVPPFCEINYRVDNGVPYPRFEMAGLFVTDSPLRTRFDPEKFVRAAAFAGWAIVRQSAEDQIMETVRLISAWLEKNAREWSPAAAVLSSSSGGGEFDTGG